MNSENKGNIVIVECRSTGTNFIGDLFARGYNPVLLDTRVPDSEDGEHYKEHLLKEREDIPYDFDVLEEAETYEETLETVRKLNPVLVLPGNEKGVILASRLAYDLNLKCNDIKNLDAMTLKDEMQKRLAEKGLRSIKGKVIKSVQEAVEFYDSEGLSQVVLKPIYSAGSASVRICTGRSEMIQSLEELFGKSNYYGDSLSEMLIQERIVGDEYIVNTVSSKGTHRVTLVWKYHKIRTPDGAIVYDTCESVNELNFGEAEMIEYAYDVADALGIEWGPVHGEYIIDENGPVLIEVNCRPCGASMSEEFLDKISGQHETDSILDAYLNPERFKNKAMMRYELNSYGALKLFIVPKMINATSSPIKNMLPKLKGHIKTSIDIDSEDKKVFFKTEDLTTIGGIVYLAHENYEVLQDSINYLRNVEKHAFSLVLSEEKEYAANDENDNSKIRELIGFCQNYGTGLFVSDEIFSDIPILQVKADEVKDIKSRFDVVILNLAKTVNDSSPSYLVETAMKIFDLVKTGGVIFIPKSTYSLLPSGRKDLEALLKLADLKIEVPYYGIKDFIIASRR